MSFSLAHLSDLHLPVPAGGVAPAGLTAKQLLALLAAHRKRARPGAGGSDRALIADLAAHAPDHVAITGDLVNVAAASEFEAARAWLARLGPADGVSVVPGNHEATAARPWRSGLGRWGEWMRGDDPVLSGHGFPFLRRRGTVALLGLSSAVPTPVGFASGRLGAGQLRRLAVLLQQAREEGLFRVVLIHHPPTMGEGGRRKALRDRAGLRDVLRRCGAELVLHGHHHVTRLAGVPGPDGPIPACGVPHANPARRGREAAGWRLYRVDRDGPGWVLSSHGRRYDPAAGGFVPSGDWTMRLAAA